MAASVDLEALYTRILGHVAPTELHRSCNGVLSSEISKLQQSLEQVTAAFTKLEEIRDAVKQLEQGKTSSGRSASLMETMEATLGMRQELGQELEKVATGLTVKASAEVGVERQGQSHKREKGEDEQKSRKKKRKVVKSSESNSSSEESEKQTPVKKTKTRTTKGDAGSSELKLAHECFELLKVVNVEKKTIMRETKEVWTSAVLCLERLIERQAAWNPSATDRPAAAVAARALDAAVAILGRVKLTTKHADEVRSLVAVLAKACSKNDILRTQFYRGRAQLESLSMTIADLPATEKDAKSSTSKRSAPVGTMSAKSKEMQGRITMRLAEVAQWQDGIFAVDQLDKVIKGVNDVMAYQAKDWNPRADPTLRECVQQLQSCVKFVKKAPLREKRIKTVGRLFKLLETNQR